MLKKSFPFAALGLILIVSTAIMWRAVNEESAIMDELAHISAGYSYVKYLDYRLNPEHPPLLKALSAIPLLHLKANFPIDRESWIKNVNDQWETGTQFLYKYGNDADKIIRYARLAPIFITIITAILLFVWSKELFGKTWALVPVFLFAFSPTVIAHGHYVTTDLAATFGVIFSTYFFIKALLQNNAKNNILAGLALGVAELAKFSNALLLPYFLILFVVDLLISKKEIKHRIWRGLKSFFLIILIAYAVVYLAYFIFTINYPQTKQITDATQILTSFSPRFLAESDLFLLKNKIFRPLGEYLLGLLMTLQRSAGGNTGYFLGEVSATGSHYYFPLVFLMKEPLPSLILIILALTVGAGVLVKSLKVRWGWKQKLEKFADFIKLHFEEFAMFLFIFIYWGWSIRSPLNIGVRHLLPTITFIYMLTTSGLTHWLRENFRVGESFWGKLFAAIGEIVKKFLKISLVTTLLIWFLAETTNASPYFLSYFNEPSGGIKNGYRFVTDSNYDWGQDLKRLATFVKENKIKKIAVDYFGGGNPKYYLGENIAENWQSARGNPKEEKIEWLAVSVNTLQNAFGKLHQGEQRKAEDGYKWLGEFRPPEPEVGNVPKPDYRAGTSIFVYKL